MAHPVGSPHPLLRRVGGWRVHPPPLPPRASAMAQASLPRFSLSGPLPHASPRHPRLGPDGAQLARGGVHVAVCSVTLRRSPRGGGRRVGGGGLARIRRPAPCHSPGLLYMYTRCARAAGVGARRAAAGRRRGARPRSLGRRRHPPMGKADWPSPKRGGTYVVGGPAGVTVAPRRRGRRRAGRVRPPPGASSGAWRLSAGFGSPTWA